MLRYASRFPLALTATIYKFDIDLADADRYVYDTLALQVARHPSESEERLVARVLAYALEFKEGIAFSPGGVSDPDAPALAVRDLTGSLQEWIEIGTPEPERLHKAAKAARRVVVYVHKDSTQFLARLAGARIHRAEALEVYAIDSRLIGALVARLERRMAFALAISERELYVSIGSETLTGRVVSLALP
jgi:uncharacterized protein YaeQ